MKALGEAALRVLARNGARAVDEADSDCGTWRFETRTPNEMRFEIRCTGPDLPATLPAELAFPADIPKEPHWQGRYRLVVAPPLVVFDVSWTPGEPLRIMNFSRGEWEAQLLRLA